MAYLQEFLTNLDQRTYAIREALERVSDRGVSLLQHRALLGAELPPMAGADPGPAWLEHRRARWEGLCLWFDPPDGRPARAEQLHAVARRAVVSLLQVLDRITESRQRSSSAVQDFRTLARWFATLPEEDDLHRLWGAAFGLTPARHAHLGHADAELVQTTASWASAPPVEVSPLLRRSGRTERFTRTGRVRDVVAVRRERQVRARAERAELEAAWRRLHTGGPVRLSDLGQLDHAGFERLLDLLGRALAGRADSTGTRRATTSDGRVEILLRPTGDGGLAVLTTPVGQFSGPDHVIDVRPAGTPSTHSAAPREVAQ